ncbi:MAG: hypothetical protein ACRD0J_16465 [Acidimicrobiales bacterium]
MRAGFWRYLMRVSFIRRLYAKRLLKYLDKLKAKRKPIPEQLRDLNLAMSRLPERERRPALEEALKGGQGTEEASREYRRAASRQQRQSGRGGPHRRPGAMRTKTPAPQGGGRPGAGGASPTRSAGSRSSGKSKPGGSRSGGRSK